MDTTAIITGIALGFAIAAPVGPIGVLCIRRTLADGRLAGLVSGLGAATADAFYGAIAASGLALAASLSVTIAPWLRIAGALFLCWLGIATFRAPAREVSSAPTVGAGGLARAYGSTLALTLANPLTIASFAGVFAGLGAGRGMHATSLVLGVFVGSALWWLALSTLVGLLRRRLSPAALLWTNRIAGTIVFLFGVAALVNRE